jgi:hypothetical protein
MLNGGVELTHVDQRSGQNGVLVPGLLVVAVPGQVVLDDEVGGGDVGRLVLVPMIKADDATRAAGRINNAQVTTMIYS